MEKDIDDDFLLFIIWYSYMCVYFILKLIIFVMESLIVFVIFYCYFVLKMCVMMRNTNDV